MWRADIKVNRAFNKRDSTFLRSVTTKWSDREIGRYKDMITVS